MGNRKSTRINSIRECETNNRNDEDEIVDLCCDLSCWMTNLPIKLRLVPVIHLAIPGSHDSFTSAIKATSQFAPDAEEFLKKFEFLGATIKHFTVQWSKTQSMNATDQLNNGIRYFDLRIGTMKNTDRLFIVHGLYSYEIEEVFMEIQSFLEQHPREIVILDCQHFYAFTQQDHERLMQMFNKIFGTKLLPYSDHMEYITLEYMTSQYRYQVIAIYRSDAARFGQPLLWPSSSFPTPWPNTMSKRKLFHALNMGIRNRPINKAYVSQCVLTPTCGYVAANLFSNLKKKCAIDLEESKLDWLDKQSPSDKGINIVISDFVELTECTYIKKVINLNAKLLELK